MWSGPNLKVHCQHSHGRGSPTMADLVSTHTGWYHRNVLGGQPLGRSKQWLTTCQEHSRSAHPTLQLGARSGADRSWKRSTTEAAQVPGSSTTTWIPAVIAPWPPAPAHFTSQPRARPGTNTTEKGTWPWAAAEQRCGHLRGRCLGSL